MGFFSKLLKKKKKNYNKGFILEPGRIDKQGINPPPSTPKPNIRPAPQGLSRKEIKISLDKEDRRIIRNLIKKYENK